MAKAEVVITAVDRTQQAIQSAQKGMKGLNDTALILQRTLGAISVAAVGAFFMRTAKQALELGASIGDAAARAGVTAQAMSELAFAAKLADTDMQSVVKSLNLLQRGLGEARLGTGEAKKGLDMLGISLQSLVNLSPDKQLEFLADAIMSLEDPTERMTVGTRLFGRSFAELIPLLQDGSAGIRSAREEAQKLGASLSQENVNDLKKAQDAIERLTAAWDGFAAKLIGTVAPALTSVFNEISGFQPAEVQLTRAIAEVERLKTTLAGLPGTGGKFGEELRAQLAAQIEIIRKLQEGAAGGPSVGGENQFRTSIITGDAISKLEQVLVTSSKVVTTATQQLYDQWNDATKTTIEKQVSQFAAFEAQIESLVGAGVITIETANERIAEQLGELLAGVEVTGKRFVETSKEDVSQLTIFAEQAARNMQSAFADFLFDPFQNGLKGMLKGFVDTIRRMVAEFAASQLMKFFFTPFASGSGLLASFAKFAIGGKAMGGSVLGSKPYIVGERGPELFVPGSNGSIVPNDRMGGVTVAPVYNIDARGATADLQKALPGILQENNRRIFDELDRRYGIGR